MVKALKFLWLGLCVTVLAITLVKFDGRPNSDIGEFLVLAMLALSFPSGLAFALLAGGAYAALKGIAGGTVTTSYLSLFLEWSGFVAVGYAQWFLFLPWLIRTIRHRASTRRASTA